MKKIFIIGLFITGLLFSCNNSEGNKKDEKKENKKENAEHASCLEIIYPITYILSDGTTITGDSKEEVNASLRSWMEANPEVTERPPMQYPVQAKFKGELISINSEEEMSSIREECAKERNDCFTFVYPVTYILPDASTITVNSEDDRENRLAIRSWYTDHPGQEGRPGLLYPLDVKLKDGSISTLENDEEMALLKKDCNPKRK